MHRFLSGNILFGVAAALALSACNSHPVTYYSPESTVEFRIDTPIEPSQKIDILWVIDNSGSMCEEQAVLRQNFDRFVDELDDAVLDFHIGVTTTHMDDTTLEPVARPGHLQSTPQPLPGYDGTCWTARDERGEALVGDYTPIRELMAAAVACMVTPNPSLLDATDEEIECGLGCANRGMCAADECGGLQLFPRPSEYRELPKVLQSNNYRNPDGTLDIDALKLDFGCMALVGMRGYGMEKGLGAAVEAISPELTGGTVESPTDASAPNHGFLRDDARFATIFVTDENDCTHDGTLSERQGVCGDDLCDYWNRAGLEDSPLVDPALLREAMLANLRAAKGVDELGEGDVRVASIHGRSVRYDGPVVPTSDCRSNGRLQSASCDAFAVCDQERDDYETVPPTCTSALGEAYSGDRYERFLRSFGDGNYYPQPSIEEPERPLTGWMCSGDFRPALTAIGEFIRTAPQGCITREIQACNPGARAACPDHANGQTGACVPRPNSDDRFFCDSYVQLRVRADNDQRARLESTGFCDTIADDGLCVVGPGTYSLGACSETTSGVRIRWNQPAVAREALAGTDLELRWIAATSH